MITTFADTIEVQTNLNIVHLLGDILETADSYLAPTFISTLESFSDSIDAYELPMENIKSMAKGELESYYKNIKRLNTFFEKIHDKFQSKAYFNDVKLKTLFKSISKRLNKVEIASYKYLMQDAPVEKTPDYIKDGLAEFSQETIGAKISA